MTTPILGIEELENGQTIQYVTANDAFRALEAAANDILEVDLSAGDATLTAEQYRGFGVFRSTGNTVSRELTLQAIKRMIMVHNSGSFSLDVTLGTTTIAVAAGVATMFYSDGTTDGLIAAS